MSSISKIFKKKVEEEVNHRITAELMRERVELTKEIIDKIDDMIGGKMIAQALKELYEVENEQRTSEKD